MIDAYVVIRSELGSEDEILREIKQIPEVKEAYQIYGVYDIILRVETGMSEELKELIEQKIRSIQNVRSTLTMIISDTEFNYKLAEAERVI